MKKYEEKSNVIGNLIREYREKKNLSKAELSRQLQLHAVYLDSTELKRIEEGNRIECLRTTCKGLLFCHHTNILIVYCKKPRLKSKNSIDNFHAE